MSNRIGEKLSQIRLQRGWKNREEAASVIGWSANALGNYERGDRQPPLDFLADFASKTESSLSELIDLCLEDLGKSSALQDVRGDYHVGDPVDCARHARTALLSADLQPEWALAIMELAAKGDISAAGVDRLVEFIEGAQRDAGHRPAGSVALLESALEPAPREK